MKTSVKAMSGGFRMPSASISSQSSNDNYSQAITADSTKSPESSGLTKSNGRYKSRSTSGESKRQASAMKPLCFEEINPGSTLHPLSSLRSCSEFQLGSAINDDVTIKSEKKRSVFSKFFRWASRKRSSESENSNNQTRKIVDNFKYKNSQIISSSSSDKLNFPLETDSVCSVPLPFERVTPTNDRCFPARKVKTKSASRNALSSLSLASWREEEDSSANVTYETQLFLDVLFGFSAHSRKSPMEIELKNLRDPQEIIHSDSTRFVDRSPINREAALHSFERYLAAHPPFVPPVNHLANFDLFKFDTWEPAIRQVMSEAVEETRDYLTGPGDELFYEAIRIQPFSSGAYLRGMLMAGFSSMFFHTYNLFFWPAIENASNQLSRGHNVVKTLLYGWLLVQFFFNILQFPFRLHIHYQCFKSSRSIEVESSIRTLRSTVESDVWLLNRGIGWIQDIFTLVGVIAIEVYLWSVDQSDPLKTVMVALSATTTLSFIIRIIVAFIFSASMHDPQVISDARRRGLSRLDIDVLPTFVYTRKEELTNTDCSICLATFDMGDMLISLPCDNRHSFHASCIRQWLQRQNSCPLCQRIV